MIRHYLKITLRTLSRQKALSFINVFGLSVGIACFSLFLLYAVNEFTFDRYHPNEKNIYRVCLKVAPMRGENGFTACYLPMPLGPAMKQDFPEVESAVRMRDGWGYEFIKANDEVTRMKVSYADAELFKVFSFHILYGSVNPLKDLHSIVLTRKVALQLFGQENAVGKSVQIKSDNNFDPFIVSAVTADNPSNSNIQFDVLGSFDYFMTTASGIGSINRWTRSGYLTYVQLRAGSKIPEGSVQLDKFRAKYYPEELEDLRKEGSWKGGPSPVTYKLQPLRDIHTDAKVSGGPVEPVDPKNIWILVGLAAAVLLIACINFTTLAIGRSAGRAKEVGVRKVIGSSKKQLIFQFLSEALVLSVLSAIFGLLLARFLLPYFNQLSGRELNFSLAQFPILGWMLAGLILVVGLLAGSYPALVLSSFRPVEVLKSKVRVGGSNIFTRSLVTLQFVLSIGLIISTVIILQQLKFMQDKNPGFNKDNIVVVDADGTDTKGTYPLFKQALSVQHSIAGVAGSDLGLGEGTGWSSSGFDYMGKHKSVFEYFVDNDYIGLMGIPVLAGRNFNRGIASDTLTSVIINEAMMNDFGWTLKNAVGQELKGYSEQFTPVVIGVVKNFNFRPFSEKVGPQLFQQFHDYSANKYFVRIKPGNPSAALGEIKKAWTAIAPAFPFNYQFLDESLDRFYHEESRWSSIVGWAGGISIFLACLGLFGLTALAAVNRKKEIGVRRVLGISMPGVVTLLAKDFLKLVLIALAIATPLAWYFMNGWLKDFAYRIHINWLVFLLTGLIAVGIAFLTISFEAIRAAVSNPVRALRNE